MESEIKNKRFILSAVNLTYRDFFDKLLISFGKPKTKTMAGKLGLSIGWRAEKLHCALTGKNPRVTKETALTALQVNRYDGSLVTRSIDFSYRDFDESVREISEYYKS
jgi:hypothetical protein